LSFKSIKTNMFAKFKTENLCKKKISWKVSNRRANYSNIPIGIERDAPLTKDLIINQLSVLAERVLEREREKERNWNNCLRTYIELTSKTAVLQRNKRLRALSGDECCCVIRASLLKNVRHNRNDRRASTRRDYIHSIFTFTFNVR